VKNGAFDMLVSVSILKNFFNRDTVSIFVNYLLIWCCPIHCLRQHK